MLLCSPSLTCRFESTKTGVFDAAAGAAADALVVPLPIQVLLPQKCTWPLAPAPVGVGLDLTLSSSTPEEGCPRCCAWAWLIWQQV